MADNIHTNPYYGPYAARENAQYANTQYTPQPPMQQDDDDEGMDFNIMEWVVRILNYWYLFLIALIIAFGAAILKNRKWMPTYYSQATVIIKENGFGYGQGTALMQGFGVDAGYKNTENQLFIQN